MIAQPQLPLPPVFRPLAERTCHHCADAIAARDGSIYAVVGADVWAWCGPACARGDGIWPWTEVVA